MIEFFMNLCTDVFFEVLQFGERRRLIKLERVGRPFHLLITKCIGGMPFIRPDIILIPGSLEINFFDGSLYIYF